MPFTLHAFALSNKAFEISYYALKVAKGLIQNKLK